MSRAEDGQGMPRAMIHRRILDVAESNPEASLMAIADEVSGASESLVDRVLDEYGDPAGASETDEQEQTTMNANSNGQQSINSTAQEPNVDFSLSEAQRDTLQVVYERPDACQGDIADVLDVTRATVSRRLNSIPGFDWTDRQPFAASVFEPGDGDGIPTEQVTESDPGHEAPDSSEETSPTTESTTEQADSSSDVQSETTAEAVETDTETDDADSPTGEAASTPDDHTEPSDETVAETDTGASPTERTSSESTADAPSIDGDETVDISLPPELAHKVVHASMNSDRVTEDEEMSLLRALMQA